MYSKQICSNDLGQQGSHAFKPLLKISVGHMYEDSSYRRYYTIHV